MSYPDHENCYPRLDSQPDLTSIHSESFRDCQLPTQRPGFVPPPPPSTPRHSVIERRSVGEQRTPSPLIKHGVYGQVRTTGEHEFLRPCSVLSFPQPEQVPLSSCHDSASVPSLDAPLPTGIRPHTQSSFTQQGTFHDLGKGSTSKQGFLRGSDSPLEKELSQSRSARSESDIEETESSTAATQKRGKFMRLISKTLSCGV